jgi:hypothetical protein
VNYNFKKFQYNNNANFTDEPMENILKVLVKYLLQDTGENNQEIQELSSEILDRLADGK